jgi:hypothetical protein
MVFPLSIQEQSGLVDLSLKKNKPPFFLGTFGEDLDPGMSSLLSSHKTRLA